MERVETLQREKRALSRGEFEKKYPHLWLLCEIDGDAHQLLYRTTVSSGQPPPPRRSRPTGELGVDPTRFVLHPLVKTGVNPWSDRILVGRAANNDVVLKNDRISKLHAYFHKGPRGWRLVDARSANGTRLDAVAVPANDEGVPVRSGQRVTFGEIEAELIGSADLYERL